MCCVSYTQTAHWCDISVHCQNWMTVDICSKALKNGQCNQIGISKNGKRKDSSLYFIFWPWNCMAGHKMFIFVYSKAKMETEGGFCCPPPPRILKNIKSNEAKQKPKIRTKKERKTIFVLCIYTFIMWIKIKITFFHDLFFSKVSL